MVKFCISYYAHLIDLGLLSSSFPSTVPMDKVGLAIFIVSLFYVRFSSEKGSNQALQMTLRFKHSPPLCDQSYTELLLCFL